MFAYLGCYTTPDRDGRGRGISVYRVGGNGGGWELVQLVEDVENPSFLAVSGDERTVYCVHGGDYNNAVSAFRRNPETGELNALNSQTSGGWNPVHVAVHPSSKWLSVANYASGSVSIMPVEPDGSIGAPDVTVQQEGECGPDPVEQSAPHPHHCPFDMEGRFLFVPDKGLDRTFIYEFDADSGALSPTGIPFVETAPGAGPRHIAFHPNGKFAYIVNELNSTVGAYAYESSSGQLGLLQTISTLPGDFEGRNTGSEIEVSKSGRSLYVSNRGHDSIAIFEVLEASGELSPVDWARTNGSTPRHFALDPDNSSLYVANQFSDAIVGFHRDQNSGMLESFPLDIQTGSPSCIVFVGR